MKKMTLKFFLCNLTAFAAGVACELLFLGQISFFINSTFMYYFLLSACRALLLPFCLYFVCFSKNKQFKSLYITYKNRFYTSSDMGKNHFRKNAKFLAIILLASVAILTAIPKHWSASSAGLANSLSTYNELVSVLISSSSFFTEYLPELIFGQDTWILRLGGALLWSVYFVLSYWLAMNAALRKWDKQGTENTKKINSRKLLVLVGMFLQLENWLTLIAYYFFDDYQNGWYKMIWSLLLITAFEILYLAEAIWAVNEKRSKFNVFKLCVVIVSALLLMSFMYYGTIETIVCNAFLVLVLIVECTSLLTAEFVDKYKG